MFKLLAVIVIEVIFEAIADARDEFIDLVHRTMAASQQEQGCVLYRFTADLENPSQLILTELWENEDALRAHFGGNAFKSFFAELPSRGRFVSYRAWQGPLVPYVPPNQAA